MNGENLRLFFALWPETAVRARLDAAAGRLHERMGGRRMHPETLHLTLVFVGELAQERLAELQALAAGIKAAKFEVLFDYADCWRHKHIAHLGASQPPPALLELVGQLESRMDRACIHFDRRPYVPHITLLRQAECAALDPGLEPISWSARDFVLLNSVSRTEGTRYALRGRWPLL